MSAETPTAAAASLGVMRPWLSSQAGVYARADMRNLVHIHQTADLAERVMLPGDPGRALRLAQELLDQPKMLNHNRGLWGYTGIAADGEPLSIQSTGMGGPSAAIVVSELIELGARRLLRIGTCGALDGGLELGELLVVDPALADDGTSRALGGLEPLAHVAAPGTLTEALLAAGGRRAAVVSADLFYDCDDRVPSWIAAGALAVEMEAATVFSVAARRGAEAGCALLVSDIVASKLHIDPEAKHAAELALGRFAIAALSR